jgi:hypothetical protein
MQQPQGKPSQEHVSRVNHGYQAAAQGKMRMKSDHACLVVFEQIVYERKIR